VLNASMLTLATATGKIFDVVNADTVTMRI
jgi:hypothetical protein